MIDSLEELRTRVVKKYKLEKALRDLVKENTALRWECINNTPVINGSREGCFEANYSGAKEDAEYGYGGSFFEASEGADVCEHCEKYLENRDAMGVMKKELGDIRRALTVYAKRELK